MFMIKLFCEDKYVADILRAIAGRSRGAPEVIPVVEAPKVGHGVKGANAAETITMFIAALDKMGKGPFDPGQIKAAIQSLGWAPTSYSHYVNGALQAKLLKRGAKASNGFLYHVVKS